MQFERRGAPSPNLFQSIVEQASDGIVVVDRDGYVLHSNRALEVMVQRRREELHGSQFGLPIVSGKSTEINLLRKDGQMAVAEMRVSEGFYDRQTVQIALLRDITQRKQMEEALLRTKEELAALYHCAPLGMIALRSDWQVKLMNPAAAAILGRAENKIIGSTLPDLSEPLQALISESAAGIKRGEAILGQEVRHVREDGTSVDLSVSLAPVNDEAGQAAGIVCIVEDITRRMRDQERLRLSGKIFENTQEGILVTDAQGIIQAVNQAFVAVTGYSEQEAIGRMPAMLSSDRHDSAYYQAMWQALAEEGQWRGEIWNRRKNGEIYPEWLNISSIEDSKGRVTHYVGIFSDITKVKENEERLLRLAHYDALTGLPNRFLFQNHAELALAQAARSGKQVAILFFDLDRFKVINDTLGHRAGDAVLIEVGRRLSACLRASDTLSRFGGDEFNAVLPNLDNGAVAANVCDKFIAALAQPMQIDGQELHITTSIGVAIYPQHGNQLDQLTRAADAAMYQAKQAGRNNFQIFESDASNQQLTRRFKLENQLRGALERGEMALVYQPEIDLESGQINGMEALLRWHHPELGNENGEIPPGEFLPIAEEIGLIGALGAWVLRQACRQNKAWQAAGHPAMCISVNLSAGQLRDRRLVESVTEILAETGLEGRWLELELTEASLSQDVDAGLSKLTALKQLGVRLSIDDFGTGHSCLGMLSRMPVDTLKIDRSFIANMLSKPADAAISRTIVMLANNLNLKVVAEGVESIEQFKMLREFQCCEAQGFYFSHPLTPESFSQLLNSDDPRQRIAALAQP